MTSAKSATWENNLPLHNYGKNRYKLSEQRVLGLFGWTDKQQLRLDSNWMTSCALLKTEPAGPKTEPVGDDLQPTALRSIDNIVMMMMNGWILVSNGNRN